MFPKQKGNYRGPLAAYIQTLAGLGETIFLNKQLTVYYVFFFFNSKGKKGSCIVLLTHPRGEGITHFPFCFPLSPGLHLVSCQVPYFCLLG